MASRLEGGGEGRHLTEFLYGYSCTDAKKIIQVQDESISWRHQQLYTEGQVDKRQLLIHTGTLNRTVYEHLPYTEPAYCLSSLCHLLRLPMPFQNFRQWSFLFLLFRYIFKNLCSSTDLWPGKVYQMHRSQGTETFNCSAGLWVSNVALGKQKVTQGEALAACIHHRGQSGIFNSLPFLSRVWHIKAISWLELLEQCLGWRFEFFLSHLLVEGQASRWWCQGTTHFQRQTCSQIVINENPNIVHPIPYYGYSIKSDLKN